MDPSKRSQGLNTCKIRRVEINAHLRKFIPLRPRGGPCRTAMQSRTTKKNWDKWGPDKEPDKGPDGEPNGGFGQRRPTEPTRGPNGAEQDNSFSL
jgi:hypothetical protein